MATSTASELSRLINKLQEERTEHVAKIAEIDATFASLGIAVEVKAATTGKKRGRPAKAKTATTGKKRGRPAKAKTAVKAAPKADAKPAPKKKVKKSKRKAGARRAFTTTGEQSVLAFIKANKNVTTAQVNTNWTNEGRSGKADNTLSKLTAAKKIKRSNIQGQRGSKYSL